MPELLLLLVVLPGVLLVVAMALTLPLLEAVQARDIDHDA